MPVSVTWRPAASADLLAIVEYIAEDNLDAAQGLKDDIEAKAAQLAQHPTLGRVGRVKGTRELVAHPNYILIYRMAGKVVEVLRVKHARQQWPANKASR